MRIRRGRAAFIIGLAAVAGALAPARAVAQTTEPISRYVLDLRGSVINLGQDPELAAQRALGPEQLPAWGWLGANVGGHVYPLRLGPVTFGVGASLHVATASRRAREDDPDPTAPAVTTRFLAVSPQLSLNFGHRDGWSYLSGGLGTSMLEVRSADASPPAQPRVKTLNYGGGARWFISPRVAFALDLRIFAINAIEQAGAQPGSPRMTRYAFSAGVSFR